MDVELAPEPKEESGVILISEGHAMQDALEKLEHYARRHAEGTISMARAAQESGVSLWEMMEYLRSKKISCPYDFQEWEQDVATVERVLATAGSDEQSPNH